MRNDTDNPLPETTQAPPASPKPASPAPPTFRLCDWVSLTAAFIRIMSFVDEKVVDAEYTEVDDKK